MYKETKLKIDPVGEIKTQKNKYQYGIGLAIDIQPSCVLM